MNLTEKNYVLAFALDDINYIVTENAGNNPGDVKKQYDCNKAAFDQIAKVIANAMRLDLIGGDLPAGTYFTPEAVRKFAEEQSKKDAGLSFEDAPNLNEVLRNPPFKGGGRGGGARTLRQVSLNPRARHPVPPLSERQHHNPRRHVARRFQQPRLRAARGARRRHAELRLARDGDERRTRRLPAPHEEPLELRALRILGDEAIPQARTPPHLPHNRKGQEGGKVTWH